MKLKRKKRRPENQEAIKRFQIKRIKKKNQEKKDTDERSNQKYKHLKTHQQTVQRKKK